MIAKVGPGAQDAEGNEQDDIPDATEYLRGFAIF